jgi:hypothetical protein
MSNSDAKFATISTVGIWEGVKVGFGVCAGAGVLIIV